jgi:hypothetical protein
MVGAGEWESLENGSRWRMGVAGEWESLENGSRWRMGVAGEWESPENGSRWRMGVAGEWESLETGDWEALETGRRWRIVVAGENLISCGQRKVRAGPLLPLATTFLYVREVKGENGRGWTVSYLLSCVACT